MEPPLPWLDEESLEFPDPATALQEPNGLLAVGGDLRPERLLRAYQHGIFPWYSERQPPLWWSPDPRMVLVPGNVHVSRSLARVMRRDIYTVTSDQHFVKVMQECAAPRPHSDGTWLLPEMQSAYRRLHELGHAHSIEVWESDTLVGGLYGVALPGIFFGESMFSRRPNTSKVALVHLSQRLGSHGYRLIDCQVASPHLRSMGAELMPRAEFLRYLPDDVAIFRPAPWPLQ